MKNLHHSVSRLEEAKPEQSAALINIHFVRGDGNGRIAV